MGTLTAKLSRKCYNLLIQHQPKYMASADGWQKAKRRWFLGGVSATFPTQADADKLAAAILKACELDNAS